MIYNKDMKEQMMREAIKQAKKAFKEGEIPIGAIIVKNGDIIAKAYNKRNKSRDATSHAEIVAIKKACKFLGDWRLVECEMFVTCVPCPMCAGAIVNSRIKKVYFGATNENQSIFENILLKSNLNHTCAFEGGMLQEECSKLLSNFFEEKR